MTDPRYDIHSDQFGYTITYHFCREIDCFGSNPDHGYTFEEAREEIAQTLEDQAKWWRTATPEDLGLHDND